MIEKQWWSTASQKALEAVVREPGITVMKLHRLLRSEAGNFERDFRRLEEERVIWVDESGVHPDDEAWTGELDRKLRVFASVGLVDFLVNDKSAHSTLAEAERESKEAEEAKFDPRVALRELCRELAGDQEETPRQPRTFLDGRAERNAARWAAKKK